jgi:CheY-like chemotaxis protein/predicted DNA-binding protein
MRELSQRMTSSKQLGKNRGGRPPSGVRPGEHMSEYPQYAGRVPQEVLDQLKAIAEVTDLPQWRVLSDAITAYIEQLPEEERRLLDELIARADGLFEQPSRAPKELVKSHDRVIILNVDDNDAMRFARTRMLEAEGYQVVEAPTGTAALALLDSVSPQIVLLDVNLPDISGLEVCRRIRADGRYARIRIVQTSATFSTPHDQLEGLIAGGADIYLAEPVSRGTLLSVLRRLVTPG